jgi:hypothetical protein
MSSSVRVHLIEEVNANRRTGDHAKNPCFHLPNHATRSMSTNRFSSRFATYVGVMCGPLSSGSTEASSSSPCLVESASAPSDSVVGVLSPGAQLGDMLRSWSRLYWMPFTFAKSLCHDLRVALLNAVCGGKVFWRVVCRFRGGRRGSRRGPWLVQLVTP